MALVGGEIVSGAGVRSAPERIIASRNRRVTMEEFHAMPHDRNRGFRGAIRILIVVATVFLLVAAIGAATSYLEETPEVADSGDTTSSSLSRSQSNDDTLRRLADYARTTGTEQPASMAATDKMLPDVDTMIERLEARLKTAPDDIEDWTMLGWSYFNTGLFEQAATAYARAVELDPSSAELKRAYEEAKAKSSEGGNADSGSSLQTEAASNVRSGLH